MSGLSAVGWVECNETQHCSH